jgi:hypothetical protein
MRASGAGSGLARADNGDAIVTELIIKVDGHMTERLEAFARYMTAWEKTEAAAEGLEPNKSWSIEEAAMGLLLEGADAWEENLRESTGLRSEPIDVVVQAALQKK